MMNLYKKEYPDFEVTCQANWCWLPQSQNGFYTNSLYFWFCSGGLTGLCSGTVMVFFKSSCNTLLPSFLLALQIVALSIVMLLVHYNKTCKLYLSWHTAQRLGHCRCRRRRVECRVLRGPPRRSYTTADEGCCQGCRNAAVSARKTTITTLGPIGPPIYHG